MKLLNARLRGEIALESPQGIAHRFDIRRPELCGQKREAVGLERLRVQLDVGQPIALDFALAPFPVQQDVVLHVIAGDKLLGEEHLALFGLEKPKIARETAPSRHDPVRNARVVEALRCQPVEVFLELAVGVVPHYHAPRVEIVQRTREPQLQLFVYI